MAPYLGLAGLFFALVIYQFIKRQPAGSEKMIEISDAVHEGAMAFFTARVLNFAGLCCCRVPLVVFQG